MIDFGEPKLYWKFDFATARISPINFSLAELWLTGVYSTDRIFLLLFLLFPFLFCLVFSFQLHQLQSSGDE